MDEVGPHRADGYPRGLASRRGGGPIEAEPLRRNSTRQPRKSEGRFDAVTDPDHRIVGHHRHVRGRQALRQAPPRQEGRQGLELLHRLPLRGVLRPDADDRGPRRLAASQHDGGARLPDRAGDGQPARDGADGPAASPARADRFALVAPHPSAGSNHPGGTGGLASSRIAPIDPSIPLGPGTSPGGRARSRCVGAGRITGRCWRRCSTSRRARPSGRFRSRPACYKGRGGSGP